MEAKDLNKLSEESNNLNSEIVSESTNESSDQALDGTSEETEVHPEDEFNTGIPNISDLEKIDYAELTKQELVVSLKTVIANFPIDQIKDEVESIKSAFYKLLKEEWDALKQAYVESGESEESFAPPIDAVEFDFKDLIKTYRDKRAQLNESIEEEKERNLKEKQEIIETIKSLINRQESLNDTFHEFRNLQQRFREIGAVPQQNVRELWANYNFAIESFYNYIQINKELRDLDLKRNYESKLLLCEKTEQLLLEPSIVHAFNALQKLHEEWREIGPVPNEKKDEIWERFKEATSIINKKHQEHFDKIKDQLKRNLDAKTELCDKAQEIVIVLGENTTPKEWEDKSKALIDLQQLWKSIGFAPKKDNALVYDRFRELCDKFFELKREFFKDYKSEQHNNLQLKTELCIQAEALKLSTDWKKTTDEFIKIQKRWKEIGAVPRKQSDLIWKRFRTACDEFFEHKGKHFNQLDEVQIDNLKVKNQIIEDLKAFVPETDSEQNFNAIQEIQRKWSETGHVPFKEKDRVNKEYRALLNGFYEKLNLDQFNKNVQKFDSKIEGYKGGDHSYEKLNQERNKIIGKIKQLESDITLWENNIGFFAKSKKSDALVKEFTNKIETSKRNIELFNKKLDMIDTTMKSLK